MSFTGKATYTAGTALPEIAEDVSDLIAVASPFETPLLHLLGDAPRPARSTIHEWIEDALLPNSDTINNPSFTNATTDTSFVVSHASRFRVGDQVQADASDEVLFVTAVNTGSGALTVVRGYGGSTAAALVNGATLRILGNAALEGDDAAAARFTSRTRKTNYTQIFSATVEASGSELAARQIGLADELDYQKQQRLREMLRDLENCVINGRAPAATPEGSSTVRRSLRGLCATIATNRFTPGAAGFPSDTLLTEEQLNLALKLIWQSSNASIDTLVVNATQKRAVNAFIAANRRFSADADAFKDGVGVYESDFGVLRIILSRWMAAGHVLLIDSSRVSVLPLAGRSFHYKPLAAVGDREGGQVIGEYTLEVRNENAHGLITGLDA